MPIYEYRCPQCMRLENRYFKLDQIQDEIVCPNCGGLAPWHPSVSYRSRPFKAFVTTHVDGKPMEITSLHQLRNIEKEYNVNFPAFGDTMLGDSGLKETSWVDANGVTHRE